MGEKQNLNPSDVRRTLLMQSVLFSLGSSFTCDMNSSSVSFRMGREIKFLIT